MTSLLRLLILLCVLAVAASGASLPALKVSANRRFLVQADGTSLFYLGDTAWELFHRLDRAEAEHYLRTRASQGFTVIQAVALAEFDALTAPSSLSDLALYLA